MEYLHIHESVRASYVLIRQELVPFRSISNPQIFGRSKFSVLSGKTLFMLW